jgi:predicted enzyme related to lactoylglutathione lyase/uncharacterized protein YciI
MLRLAVAALAAAALMVSVAAGADGEMGMGNYYAVELEIADPASLADPGQLRILGQHVGHLRSLYDRGVLVMAGPFDEGGEEGLAVVTAASIEEARGYFETDPSVIAGLMLIDDVHHWWTPFNRPDNKTFSVEEFRAMMANKPPMDQASAADSMEDANAGEDINGAEEDEDEGASEGKAMVDGALVHFELPSGDFVKVQGFYSHLFGWEFMPMGEAYLLYSTPGGEGGGFTKDMPPGSGALFYIYAADVPSKLKDVVEAGGKVFLNTTPVPGYGWVAVFEDLEGNKVGLFSGEDPPPGESPVPEM